MLDEEGASLIALWVWHFPWQDRDFNIPSSDAQPLLVKQMTEFSAEHAGLD
jgi:mannan endo-1,4-beta-mannosidase